MKRMGKRIKFSVPVKLMDELTTKLSFNELGILFALTRYADKDGTLVIPDTDTPLTISEITKRLGLIKKQRTSEYLGRIEKTGVLKLRDGIYAIDSDFVYLLKGEQHPLQRKTISPTLRFAVLNRDRFRCVYCGRGSGENVKLHVDHKVPVALGGQNTIDNLVASCQECNAGKRAMELSFLGGGDNATS